jgi:hypothetical protein
MAFKLLRDGWIRSDEGFSVRYEDRLHVLYREGDRTMRVGGEWLFTVGFLLETRSLDAWEPPHEHEPVLRDRLVVRVKDALEFTGIEVSVDTT